MMIYDRLTEETALGAMIEDRDRLFAMWQKADALARAKSNEEARLGGVLRQAYKDCDTLRGKVWGLSEDMRHLMR